MNGVLLQLSAEMARRSSACIPNGMREEDGTVVLVQQNQFQKYTRRIALLACGIKLESVLIRRSLLVMLVELTAYMRLKMETLPVARTGKDCGMETRLDPSYGMRTFIPSVPDKTFFPSG